MTSSNRLTLWMLPVLTLCVAVVYFSNSYWTKLLAGLPVVLFLVWTLVHIRKSTKASATSKAAAAVLLLIAILVLTVKILEYVLRART